MGCGGSKEKPSEKPPKPASKHGTKKNTPISGPNSARGGTNSTHAANIARRSHLKDEAPPTSPRRPPKGRSRRHSHLSRRTVTSDALSSNFVPCEAENLTLDGNWEIEKGVDDETLVMDNSYPVPRLGKPVSDKINFGPVDYEVMKNSDMKLAAGTFPDVAMRLTGHLQSDILKNSDMKLAAGTFPDVATRLTGHLQSDILKVRALTTWMSGQKIRTRMYGADAKPGTVLGYMKRIKELTGTFAGLLTNLCRAIDIPCVIVKGTYRSFMHVVGEDDLAGSRSTWCAVHVDGSWQLVHPFLMCTPLCSSTLTEGWKLLETSKDPSKPNTAGVLNTFFFAPKPSNFIHCCVPDDNNSYWQLKEPRTHYSKFLKLPFLRPAFFSNKMTLTSEQKCVIMSHNGRGNFKLKSDIDTASQTEIMYELYSLDEDLEMDSEWENIVLCARNEDTWIVQIKFPVDGTFKLALYGRISDWIFWLADFKIPRRSCPGPACNVTWAGDQADCVRRRDSWRPPTRAGSSSTSPTRNMFSTDFKIICDVPATPFVPWPSVSRDVGWGPGRLCQEAGLLAPSHQGGIVFYKPNEEHVLKFLVNDKLRARCEIEHPNYDTDDLVKYCRTKPRKCEIDFVVNLPLSGEFAVRIYVLNDTSNDDTGVNVCNYLFTDWDDLRPRENVFQRKARWNLREAAAGHDIAVLESCLAKFTSVKLQQDDDYLRGQRRLTYLKLKKGLRDGRMRLHEETLAAAISDAETSQFKHALQTNIARATCVLDSLRSLEMHCHPVLEMDAQTIAEIANYANPPRDVHSTMIATYLLLGEEKKALQKWGYIQGLLRRQGREGIKHRVDQFRKNEAVAMPSQATLETVSHIHADIPKEYILSASLSATTFYDWVSGVLSYVSNYSQNAQDANDSYDTDAGDFPDGHDHPPGGGGGDKHRPYGSDPESISQDEGFLDSQDIEPSTRNTTEMH